MRGHFLSFDGGEGSGKTSKIHRLSLELVEMGRPTLLTREPGGTEEGRQLRRMLTTDGQGWEPMSELLLITASRVQHVNKIIKPALEMGQTVLCDRFVDSTLAYQGAAGGVPEEVILALHRGATDDLWPDLTIILDIDPEEGLRRASGQDGGVRGTRFKRKDLAFHQRVREGFLRQAERHPARYRVFDASGDPDAVYRDVRAAVFAHLGL
jgi:dTMP kinase